MSLWLSVATACCAAVFAVQALEIGAKLRLALFVAQWSALFWIGVRVASFSLGAVA
jgi:hypothetical protein